MKEKKVPTVAELLEKADKEYQEALGYARERQEQKKELIARNYQLLPMLLAEGFEVEQLAYSEYWSGVNLTIVLPQMPCRKTDKTIYREWVQRRAKLRSILGKPTQPPGVHLLPDHEQPQPTRKHERVPTLVQCRAPIADMPGVSVQWIQALEKGTKCKVKVERTKAESRRILVCER